MDDPVCVPPQPSAGVDDRAYGFEGLDLTIAVLKSDAEAGFLSVFEIRFQVLFEGDDAWGRLKQWRRCRSRDQSDRRGWCRSQANSYRWRWYRVALASGAKDNDKEDY